MNQLIYVSDIIAYKSLIEEISISKNKTNLVTKDNLGLIYVNDLLINLEDYSFLESLGDYEDMFLDENLHAKYLSVNDYLTPLTYDDEGETVTYYKPKYIGKFAEKTISLEEFRIQKVEEIKGNSPHLNPITLEVDLLDGTTQNITFNGGDSSASAINGAVILAQNLEETSLQLWDFENNVYDFDLNEALLISALIAKNYRDIMLERQAKLKAISEATTIEMLKVIKWS